MQAIEHGNLGQVTTNLDQALYVASVLCVSGPVRIHCTTHKDWADPTTGERYLVIREDEPLSRHLRDDQEWEHVYTLSRAEK
jgi:hypothetical protein